jgi:prepilin-type N-terminal cleavage/methylation domain-containing protein
MKKKGFTLVELLVVIAIIALLMGILMPALARVRQIAFRMVCGSNLSGIGKAMLIYANDYEDEFPKAGGKTSSLGPTANWMGADRFIAFGMPGGVAGKASISACLYNLVKFAEVTPKSFICKGDAGTTEFKPTMESPLPPTTMELIDFWDFGSNPPTHCSYSYHLPLPLAVGGVYAYALTTSSEPGMAVAADRNPWIPPPGLTVGKDPTGPPPLPPFNVGPTATTEQQKAGNAISHQGDGQNVLFLDCSVRFEKRAFCAIDDDNIYTTWGGTEPKRHGVIPQPLSSGPQDRLDSFLINDGPVTIKVRSCFPADTPVWVDGKLVQISKVIAGTKVGKLDSAGSAAGLIEGVEEHGEGLNDCYDMVLESGNSITVVHSHYFLTASGRWAAVEELTSGTKLQSLKGPISITSVVKRTTPFTGKCYNLVVKGAEQYFVGKDGVVALDCSKDTWELLKLAR